MKKCIGMRGYNAILPQQDGLSLKQCSVGVEYIAVMAPSENGELNG
jgi:hypothetical protein